MQRVTACPRRGGEEGDGAAFALKEAEIILSISDERLRGEQGHVTTATTYRPQEEKGENENSFQQLSKKAEMSGRRDLNSISRTTESSPAAKPWDGTGDVSWLQQDEKPPREQSWEIPGPETGVWAPPRRSLHQLLEQQEGK